MNRNCFSAASGEARGTLESHRGILRGLLEEKFGPLPGDLTARIAQADLPTLQAALKQVLRIQTIDELRI